MKKNMIITAFLLVFSIASFAQTEKGKFMIGGNFDFSTNNSGSRVTELNLSPAAGYFIANNLAVGIGLDYSLKKDFLVQNSIAVEPFARYYFGKSEKLKFFGEAGLGLEWGGIKRLEDVDILDDNKFNGLTYHVGIGASYFFTKKIALEVMLQHKQTYYKRKSYNSRYSKLGAKIGLRIHF